MATSWAITIDCASPQLLASFWKVALDYVDAPPPHGFDSWRAWLIACDVPEGEWDDGASVVDPDGIAPQISFLKVPEGKTTKNRVHLDLKVSGGRAVDGELRSERILKKVDQLRGLGATVIDKYFIFENLDHYVLADPEGNEFCVA